MATVEHCLFCFEALAAELEKRTPMSLYQVTVSWAEYPKGLEEEPNGDASEDEDGDEDASAGTSEQEGSSKLKKPKLNPALQRLAAPRGDSTGSSTPSSTSSTSLAPSTTNSTPASSTYSSDSPSFRPVGIGQRSSQHAITAITESPLFVTWNKVYPHTAPRLRGCIGTFESQTLASGLSSYALTSAMGDTRFNPVTLSELPRLEVAVTLLTDFETCNDPMDWELGVHGLKVSFYHHHKRYGATYLPDVAVEQGWTKEETLLSLMRKAGWLGRREKWREVGDLKVVRYQGKKESVDYEEYRKWKDWVDNKKKETEES